MRGAFARYSDPMVKKKEEEEKEQGSAIAPLYEWEYNRGKLTSDLLFLMPLETSLS